MDLRHLVRRPDCQWHWAEAVTGGGKTIMGKGSPPCIRQSTSLVMDVDGVGLYLCDHHVEVLRQCGATVGEEWDAWENYG